KQLLPPFEVAALQGCVKPLIEINLPRLFRRRLFQARHNVYIFLKVDSGHEVVRTDSLSHGGENYSIYRAFVVKLDFRLCRVNIHIDVTRIYFQKYGIEWIGALRQEPFEGRHHGVVKVVTPNEAIVYKDKLLATGSLGSVRPTDIAVQLHKIRFFTARSKLFLVRLSEE